MNLNVRVITPDKVVWDAMVEELFYQAAQVNLVFFKITLHY